MADENRPDEGIGQSPETLEKHHESRGATGPLAVQFPADPVIWNEARRLAGDKNVRVEELATAAAQDPVVVIELLRISNAMYFAGGRSAITSARTAIVRLGSDVVIGCLDEIKTRPSIVDPDVSHYLEIHRSRAKRTAIVARILAEALNRPMADDCQTAGLLTSIGEMIAVVHFEHRYVSLAEEYSRQGVLYRLVNELRFDPEKMGLEYLRKSGIPEALLFALDREARARSRERAIMKPLTMAAVEMVDSFDSNRWEKIAPGQTIPPKSNLRLLQITDAQYLRIYERSSEYLFSARLFEERKKQEAIKSPEILQFDTPEELESQQDSLQSEIQLLIRGDLAPDEESEPKEATPVASVAEPTGEAEIEPPSFPDDDAEDWGGIEERPVETAIHELDENIEEQFDLGALRAQNKREARSQEPSGPVKAPVMLSAKANTVVASVNSMLEEASTSEELLSELLDMLTEGGPFKKSALIVVSKDRKQALVVTARGEGIGNGQRLILDDPLSPLAQCFSKVQSFGTRESKNSPFGSKSFALAPIDADHDTPVALYADCGNDGAISFEARRVFRTVVELLNQQLPKVPGGIPVEYRP